MSAGCFQFGPYCLDVGRRELRRGDLQLALTPKAFDVLHHLVLHADRVVRKDELMSHIWRDTFVGDDTLTQNIASIRKVLSDSSEHPCYVATVPRHGYRFVADVRRADVRRVDEADLAGREAATAGVDTPALRAAAPAAASAGQAGPPRPNARVLWVAAGAVLASLLLLIPALVSAGRVRRDPLIRFSAQPAGRATTVRAGAASPDGTQVVFVAADSEGETCLWLRALDVVNAHEIPGTHGAAQPFWTNDGTAIGFFAEGLLKLFDLRTRVLRTVVTVPGTMPAGATANQQGVVLFASGRSGLFSVPISGGTSSVVTQLDRAASEVQHLWPQFLPDGRHYLYGVRGTNSAVNGVYVGSLDSNLKRRVLPVTTMAIHAAGHLVFVRDNVLMGQAFDLQELQTTAAAQPLATEVSPSGFSASAALLTYQDRCGPNRIAWFERDGRRISTLDMPTELTRLALSPDERQLAATDASSPTAGIWLVDLTRGAASRFTTIGSHPLWAPDGRAVVFSSSEAGVLDMYEKPSLGDDGRQRALLRSGHSVWPQDWSSDGRAIVYATAGNTTKYDLWWLKLPEAEAIPYLQTSANETSGQLSPDGRWLAYASDESGRWEVHVAAFPSPGRKWTVSTRGGTEPRWRDDGKELYYLDRHRNLMAVTIRTRDHRALEISTPETLFATSGCHDPTASPTYVVTAHGRRFLAIASDSDTRQPLTAVVNWTTALSSVPVTTGEPRRLYQTPLSALLRAYSQQP